MDQRKLRIKWQERHRENFQQLKITVTKNPVTIARENLGAVYATWPQTFYNRSRDLDQGVHMYNQ